MRYIKVKIKSKAVSKWNTWANELAEMKLKDIKKKYGKSIGKGRTRINFREGKFVIKRAMNEPGLDQNKRQIEVWDLGNKKVLAPVFAYSKDYKIIIMGYAIPFRKFSKNTKKKIGIKKCEYTTTMFDRSGDVLTGQKWEFLNNWDWGMIGNANAYTKNGEIGFIGDFVRPSSYGKLGNKIVLIDYGF